MDDAPAMNLGARPAGRRGFFPAVLVGGMFALALVRLARLVQACAVNLPFQDQWDLLRPLFSDAGPWACFDLQHGPHRQGLGGLINWFVYRATAWDVRAEAWAATVILALAALAAIRLAARLRGRLAWTDAAIPLLLMATVNWETMLLTPNLSHGILPLLLTLCLALVWTGPDRAARPVLVIGLGWLALFTGFAACAFLVSLALAVGRAIRPSADEPVYRRWRWAVLAGFGAALLLFARGYVWSPAVPNWRFPVEPLWNYPRFLALMYANLTGWREISPAALATGGVLLALVLGAFGWALRGLAVGRATPRATAVFLLTGTALVFGGFTAVGRLPAGIEAAFMWRYLPLLLPALVGLMLALEEWTVATAPRVRALAGVAGLLPALVVWGNFTPDRYAAVIAGGKRRWIESYLATHDLAAANQRSDFFVYRGDPESAVIAGRLRWLEERRLTFFKDAPPPAAP
jgi:hypothetical protein